MLRDALDPHTFVRRRSGFGGPAPEVVESHVTRAEHELEETVDRLGKLKDKLEEARESLRAPREETV